MSRIAPLLLLLSLFTLTHSHCIHDEMLRKNPVEHIVSDVAYVPQRRVMRNGREVLEDAYAPLRVHFYTAQLDQDLAGETTKLNFLKNTVFPQAADRFANLLNVVPVQGNLKLDRKCGQFYADTANEQRKCTTYSDVACGDFGSIPAVHYTSQPIYSSATTISGYTTGGNGIANADVVIYVSAKETSSCSGASSTLAYAAHCVQDRKDRPVAGYVNFCRSRVDVENAEKAIVTTLHEVGHVLAYSSSLFPYYRKEDGTAYTKRRLGSTGSYTLDHGTPNPTISEETMKTFSERGNSVKKLTLPKAVAAAREHFNCDRLNGVELENQGGSGTDSSHPEMRVYYNDFMNGQYPAFPVVSRTTLAVFESSGWYKSNYDKAEFHSWGYKKGCDFAVEKCIAGGTAVDSKHFCTATTQEVRCTQDLLGFGLCSTITYTADLPTQYQYFSNPRMGGSQLFDYCPIYETFNWSPGTYPGGQAICTNPNGGPSQNSRGEIYGTGSRCLVNTLLANQYQGAANSMSGGCFQFECRNETLRIYVQAANTTFVDCGKDDEGSSRTITGYKGVLYCPDFSVACPPGPTPGPPGPIDPGCTLDCGLNGRCTDNFTCVCSTGWEGDRCEFENREGGASLLELSIVLVIMALVAQLCLLL